jgi:DNA-binding transcriptional LysR family regulator
MDVRQLEYFVAVAEELNFTRAAQRCHVAQSALSHQIARLEREHHALLFERTSRRVRLAPAGELLLPRARSVLAELATAGSELSALSGLVTGRLRIGMISSAGPAASVVERALATFHRLHPAVEIAIRDAGSHLMAEQVRDGELDLAFVGLFADQVPPDLVHTVLEVEPLVAAVPPAHPQAGRTSVALAELADTAFVEMRPESGLRRQVDAAFDRAGVTRRVAFELATSHAVARFVGLGFGAALVPRSTAQHASGIGVITLDDAQARHPVSVVHRPRPAAPSARELLRLISERPRPAAV